eukprot:CAMPEP_0173256226 /NCGR_PEP_ID=MMETSP1142-20121109/23027_1 /TAXON_ID=483371 /ORGANISM="non described non described, Strain CCMP2298" /LENGTH=271 /DNA_ID=CAMNT_0014190081 /DNA_START=123 /DNA_END=936 /DNA_ORIENTATION=+
MALVGVQGAGYLSNFPTGCNEAAAIQCEREFLLCKLFNGPADDKDTLCSCAAVFYGDCLRSAGCETAREVGPLSANLIYMKTCVDFIIENNCPDPLICATNCASDRSINTDIMKIIPFNNYGQRYLRIRTCLFKYHTQRLERYSTIEQVACSSLSDFEVCSRLIPPNTYVPVALPLNTTYIEIDSCDVIDNLGTDNQTYSCDSTNPSRVYGNERIFPRSFDVAQTNLSVCSNNDDCLGSFCDFQYHPSICSPKTIKQALGTGADYLKVGYR